MPSLPLPLFIGYRYLRSKQRNRFAAFIGLASVLGIALGVAVLIIVLSVMNGFEREVTQHILGMTADVTVFGGGEPSDDWRAAATQVGRVNGVQSVAPFIHGSAMLNRRGHVQGIEIYGIPVTPNAESARLQTYLKAPLATLAAPSAVPNLFLGATLAEKLEAKPGDMAILIIPRWDPKNGLRAPLYQQVKISALFSVGMHEFDSTFGLMDIRRASEVFELGDRVSGMRVRLLDSQAAPLAARSIQTVLGNRYLAFDWSQFHRNFFQALKSQKRILFLILSIIIAVAAFNIVASMVMLVKEKSADIAILRTLGLSSTKVLQIFITQGIVIAAGGVTMGIVGGLAGARYANGFMHWVERAFHVQFIKPDVYYINYLPTEVLWSDIAVVGITAFVISVVATLYPAAQAARVAPTDTLRFE